MRSLTYGELIRGNRNFRNLLAGQFISELGNWFNFIAGLGLVRLVSDASPTAAGLFFVARLWIGGWTLAGRAALWLRRPGLHGEG